MRYNRILDCRRRLDEREVEMRSLPYVVHVSEKDGFFELRVRELCIVVRGSDLSEAYEALRRRADKLADWAARIGDIDLPTPLHKIR